MGKSTLTATIKKIEIINKATADNWEQSIRIILGDIELNNDNLVELRKFKPNEAVTVCFESQQMNLMDLPFAENPSVPEDNIPEDLTEDIQEGATQQEIYLIEGIEEANPEDIIQVFTFNCSR